MRDINKYIFVDAEDMVRNTYTTRRVGYCNDFETEYTETGVEDADRIFESMGIPKEARKFIIMVRPFKDNGYEFVTEKGYRLIKNRKLVLRGVSHERRIDKYNAFISTGEKHDYYDVINFFKYLSDNNLLENYLRSISSFYGKDCLHDLSFLSKDGQTAFSNGDLVKVLYDDESIDNYFIDEWDNWFNEATGLPKVLLYEIRNKKCKHVLTRKK